MNNTNSIFKSLGREVRLYQPDGWVSTPYKAVMQPLRYKNKMYLEGIHTEIGINNEGYYLYLGPASHDLTKLSEDAWLIVNGVKHEIVRAEKVYCGEKPVYIWAVMRTITGVI